MCIDISFIEELATLEEKKDGFSAFTEKMRYFMWPNLFVSSLILIIILMLGVFLVYKRRLRFFEANILVLMFVSTLIGIITKMHMIIAGE